MRYFIALAMLVMVAVVTTPASAEAGWRKIDHHTTMNCWPAGTIKRGKFVTGTCNGRMTKCKGGSFTYNRSRQCWVKTSSRSSRREGHAVEIGHQWSMRRRGGPWASGSIPYMEWKCTWWRGEKRCCRGGSFSRRKDRYCIAYR